MRAIGNSIYSENKYLIVFVLLVLLTVQAVYLLSDYFNFGPLFFAGIALIIYSFETGEITRNTKWWLLFLPVCIYFSYTGVKTFYFLAVVFSIIWVIESNFGKINLMCFLILLVISPIGTYLFSTLTFPFRLLITQLAVDLLNLLGLNIWSEGNIINLNNSSYSVDEACSGLNMLQTALLFMAMLLTYFTKERYYIVTLKELIKWSIVTILLAVISNYFRILTLIFFKIEETHSMHYSVGLFCLVVYCLFPLTFLIQKYCFSKKLITTKTSTVSYFRFSNSLAIFIVTAVFISGYWGDKPKTNANISLPSIQGYQSQRLNHSITKLSNAQSLIYLKPLDNFYSTDHNPSVCWKGSGYEIKSFKTISINNMIVYSGVLKKGNDLMYTAWWYQSSKTTTISQIEWRQRALLKNEHFWLININAATEFHLYTQIKQVEKGMIAASL